MTKAGNWKCIEIPCDERHSEELAGCIVEAFGVGVEITENGIRFYLEAECLPEEWESRLQRVLADPIVMDSTKRSLAYSTYELPEADWAECWKEHFRPLRVGRRFVVCPTWETFAPAPEDLIILMDPGRAFGTGHHESTRLCMEWLEDFTGSQADIQSYSLLDVGTGSGILAVASAMLGFGSVIGVDSDPEAIEVAAENLILNRVTDRVRLVQGSVTDINGVFEVVVANIQARPLIQMGAELAAHVKGIGRLSVSGILLEQLDEVKSAYARHGLKHIGTRTAGEWGLLAFER